MIDRILILFLLVTFSLDAQPEYKPWIKGEQERYLRSIQLSKINYPGDETIDVTYYGLDIKVTHSPQYISGSVIITAKADTSSINSCWLDLRDFLIVDSVLLNETAIAYTYSNNKQQAVLEPLNLRLIMAARLYGH